MSLLAFTLFYGRYLPEDIKKSCKYFHRVSTTSVYFSFHVCNFKLVAYVIICMREIVSDFHEKCISGRTFTNKIFVQPNVNILKLVSSFNH